MVYNNKKYRFKDASHIKVDAQVAGEVCEELERTVGLTARTLLNASRDEDAPLHDEFEWDDEEAAEKYREEQARHIINCLCIIVEEDEEEPDEPKTFARAFYTTTTEPNYEHIIRILPDEEKRKRLLAQALREIEVFRKKYAILEELIPLFAVADEIKEKTNEHEQIEGEDS